MRVHTRAVLLADTTEKARKNYEIDGLKVANKKKMQKKMKKV